MKIISTTQQLATLANNSIVLAANPSSISFGRQGDDLVITDENSDVTMVADFFNAGMGKDLPDFVLPDGTTIAGLDFLTAQNSDMDLTTAAGPSTASSSGLNAYAVDNSTLLGGVDMLEVGEGLGTWASLGAGAAEIVPADIVPGDNLATLIEASSLDAPPISGVVPGTPPPSPPPVTFGVIAGHYVHDHNNNDFTGASEFFSNMDNGLLHDNTMVINGKLNLNVVGAKIDSETIGDLMSAQVSAIYASSLDDGTSFGQGVTNNITASEMNINASAERQDGAQGMFSYHAVGVAAHHGGKNILTADAVNIQAQGEQALGMVAKDDYGYSGAIRTQNIINSQNVSIGVKPADNYEWSYLQAMSASYNAENIINATGTGDASVVINGNIGGYGKRSLNQITTGDGNDGVTINGYLQGGHHALNKIETGAGNDTVFVTGMISAEQGAINRINTGEGDDFVRIAEDITSNAYFSTAAEATSNQIFTGNGNDTIELGGSLLAGSSNYNSYSSYGHTHTVLDAGAGDDLIHITGDMRAENNVGAYYNSRSFTTSNTILGGEGSDTITIDGTVQAGHLHNPSAALNTISGGSGDDYITIGGNVSTQKNGKNSISGDGGNDTVVINGTVSGNTIIDLGADDDILFLNGFTGGTLLGGSGHDALHLMLDGKNINATFSALNSSTVSGFEELVLDFRGGSNDALNLDALLGVAKNITSDQQITLKVDAAEADAIDTTNWTYMGDNQWSNNIDEITFMIQTGI